MNRPGKDRRSILQGLIALAVVLGVVLVFVKIVFPGTEGKSFVMPVPTASLTPEILEPSLTSAVPGVVATIMPASPTPAEQQVIPEVEDSPQETGLGQKPIEGLDPMDRAGTLWAPFLEWTLENLTYEGNPFDLLASATFTHTESGEIRSTEMFYAGEDSWKFRFTGTRTGEWTFFTSSEDQELDQHTGKITIIPNPDPQIKGFLIGYGNRFARQVGENGELEGVLFNVWQSGHSEQTGITNWYKNPDYRNDLDATIENELLKHGLKVLYSGLIANRWFDINAIAWDEHQSENPDLGTFEALENAITYLHSRGYHMHIWMWGDETRRQTPIGVGGINGKPDQRLQRYLAARLGPLPGWSMGYGFDLGDRDWIAGDTNKLEFWANNLSERMGWQHLLFTRGFAPAALNGISYSSNGPGNRSGQLQTSPNGPADYDEVVRHIDSDFNRPHLYEERFIFLREFADGPPWTMERTRRVLWWNTLAGGVGAWWGYWDGPLPSHPEQMETHTRFWDGRFLLDMERANTLTDGFALRSRAADRYVFYKEDASTVFMNLTVMSEPRSAFAVDTTRRYEELPIGILEAGEYTWDAPYPSDWAVAVGFGE